MSKSIVQKEYDECYLCGNTRWLEEHHIFGGANRKLSEHYGLKVKLCHMCHNEPPEGVHFNTENMLSLRKIGQKAFEKTHTREDFVRTFGKSYL